MMRRAGRWGAAVSVAALGLFGLSYPAAAARTSDVVLPSPSADHTAPNFPLTLPVATAAAWLSSALSVRANQLTTLSQSITASSALTVLDRTALSGLVSTDATAIGALETKVPTETTILALRADAQLMIGAHVMVFLTPLVNDLLAADADLSSEHSLRYEATALGAAITAARQAKHDVTAPSIDYRDLGSRLNDVDLQLAGVSDTLLALQPSSWPAPVSTFQMTKAAISHANADLSAANADVNAIVRLLAHPTTKTTAARKALSRA